MWLVLPNIGFFSVIAAPHAAGAAPQVVVRARQRRQLERLVATVPALRAVMPPIHDTPGRDYACRILVARSDWAQALRQIGEQLDYGNVKAAAASGPAGDDPGFVAALHEAWGLLRRHLSQPAPAADHHTGTIGTSDTRNTANITNTTSKSSTSSTSSTSNSRRPRRQGRRKWR